MEPLADRRSNAKSASGSAACPKRTRPGVRLAGRERPAVCRHYSRANFLTRPISHLLARNEAKILRRLSSVADHGLPQLIHFGDGMCLRSYIEGVSLKVSQAPDQAYYDSALSLLGELHAAGVVHNDLEKPENWLVTPNGAAAIIDFQLARFFRRKGRLFRLAQREDLRHLLKNKKRFCASGLSEEETVLVKTKSLPAKFNRRFLKPIYKFVTRGLLKYSDRGNSKYSR